MNPPERWQEVKEFLYSALEMVDRPSARPFLDKKCGDDVELRARSSR